MVEPRGATIAVAYTGAAWGRDGTARRGGGAELAGLRKPRARHDPGRILIDMAVAVTDGARTISDVAVLADQAELFGAVALDSTCWRLVDQLDAMQLGAVARARAATREVLRVQRAELTDQPFPPAKAPAPAGQGELANAEPKTLRYRPPHVAARLTRGQRRTWRRIQRSWQGRGRDLAAAFTRLVNFALADIDGEQWIAMLSPLLRTIFAPAERRPRATPKIQGETARSHLTRSDR